ncbi:MAG: MarR family transcriptional regulator [Firmicutes bacterium]|nr:MarR family transcriptional regulator [Bacillota bacterium]
MAQEAELFTLIFRLVRSFEREFREQGSQELSTTQFEALTHLEKVQPVTAMALAALLHIKGPTATRALDSLARRRYIMKERDPQDRRVIWLRMTDQGAAVLQQERDRQRQWMVHVLQRLTAEEKARLSELLKKLTIETSGSDATGDVV